MMYCFYNGDTLPATDARVHVSDLGLLRSYGAFDYLRTFGGRPFRLHDHLARFRNSATGLMLPLDYSDDEIRAIILDLLERSDIDEAGVRLVITGGESTDSMTVIKPNFFIVVEALPGYPESYYQDGVKLITSEYLRDVPELKSTGYLNAVLLMPLAQKHGAHDVLYCHGGRVLELTRNNFFLFKGDTMVTPKDDILLGITRKVLLEICGGEFDIEQRPVAVPELSEAGEAFLCGTTKGIMPVVHVDEAPIGDGRVGPNTRKVMDLFHHYTKSGAGTV